jgi:hypothetical protein
MSRHIENLSRLLSKLRERYGEQDATVIELRAELESLQMMDSISIQSRMPFGERRRDKTAARFWTAACRTDAPVKHG